MKLKKTYVKDFFYQNRLFLRLYFPSFGVSKVFGDPTVEFLISSVLQSEIRVVTLKGRSSTPIDKRSFIASKDSNTFEC